MRARFTDRSSRRGLGPVLLSCSTVICLVAACANVDTTIVPTTTIGPGTTSVYVDPASFLGSVACTDRPGGMQSYVATITDQTAQFTLPSSPPTSCSQPAYFEYVTVGDGFTADIDGYEEAPGELVPACALEGPATPLPPKAMCALDTDCEVAFGCSGRCLVTTYQNPVTPSSACLTYCGSNADCAKQCGFQTDFAKLNRPCGAVAPPSSGGPFACSCQYVAVEGDRRMYSKKTGLPVSPRWKTPADQPCGLGLSQPVAVAFVNASIGGCQPLQDTQSSITAIQLYPDAALGPLRCLAPAPDGGVTGTVTTFDVVPADSKLPSSLGLPCFSSAGVTFTQAQGVVPGASYTFELRAHEAGALGPTQAASCVATARAGISVVAACDPLVPIP